MNTQASSQGLQTNDVKAVVSEVLDTRDKTAAEVREREALKARASEAEAKSKELEARVAELDAARDVKNSEVEELRAQVKRYDEVVGTLVKEHTKASTPSEISLIDSAKDGQDAFLAKIDWINKSMSNLSSRASRADELEAKLAEAELVVREQEVRALFGNLFSDDAVEAMVSRASAFNDEDYEAWRDEKELMVLEMSQARELDDEQKKKLKMKKLDESKAGDNPFSQLLAQRRSESMMANPDTMRSNPNEPDLVNHPGDGSTDVRSKVSPEQLRTPRWRIEGAAGNDLANQLDNAQVDGDVQLAGARAGDDGEGVSPFRVLANLVTDPVEDKSKAEKPSFDPVS